MSVVGSDATLVREGIHVFFGSDRRNTAGGFGRDALSRNAHEADGVCEHGCDEG